MTDEYRSRFEISGAILPSWPQPLDWRRAHEELSRLAQSRARLDWEEGHALLLAIRAGAHLALGFATFGEYVERLLGYTPRWTAERLRVAEALERLPELDQALRDAAISWSAARELTRVAVPENEHQWIEVAQGRTLRQVEELVSGHRSGDAPGEPTGASSPTHILRHQVSPETFATFREAMAKVRRDAGEPLDEDAALLLMARHVLGGPSDTGRSSYQIALTICEQCGRGSQQGRGERSPVGQEVVEMASCDAQQLAHIPPPAVKAPEQRSAAGTSSACPVDHAAHVGHRSQVERADSNPTECAHTDTGNPPPATTARPVRARQNVPPAVRREVLRRDRGRCVVPACRNAVFVDVHHIELRSEGGNHDPDALIVLCSAHHRAAHRGQLIIAGRVATGLTFRHADGARYGAAMDPHVAHAHVEAFRALRALGFREGETRGALECVRAETHAGDTSIEGVLRSALAVLSAPPHLARHRVDMTSTMGAT